MSGYIDRKLVADPVPALSSLAPIPYLNAVLANQDLPVEIGSALDLMLLGDSLTDLVAGATFSASNGATFNQPVDETTQANLQSNLVKGRFTFPATNSRIDADLLSTFNIGTESFLAVGVFRFPQIPSSTRYFMGDRSASVGNPGWEDGITADPMGTKVSTADDGVIALTSTELTRDETRDQPNGTWRVVGVYRNAAGGGTWQGATDRELGPQLAFAGDLTSDRPLSLGAGRAQGVALAECLALFGWRGALLDNRFGAGSNGIPVDGKPNVMQNVCLPIFADMVGGHVVSARYS